jgi:hypothetical protein
MPIPWALISLEVFFKTGTSFLSKNLKFSGDNVHF